LKAFSKYEIPFVGLKNGEHVFNYSVDADFFAEFEESLVSDGKFDIELIFDKNNFFTLTFNIDGYMLAECDRCVEQFQLNFSESYPLLVKFNDNTTMDENIPDSDDDLIYISRNETHLNVARFIHEFIILSIPIKKVHPDDENGNPGCEMKYQNQIGDDVDDAEEESTDPRWEALKKLKNN